MIVQDGLPWRSADRGRIDRGSATRTVAPTVLPVSEVEFGEHSRLGSDLGGEVVGIRALLFEVVEYIERSLGISIMQQTWRLTYDRRFPSVILLRYPPVQSVTSVQYVDEDGATQTLDPALYRVALNGEWSASITPAFDETWPTTRDVTEAVTVTYVTGHATAAAVPADLKRAVKLLAAHWFEHREAGMEGREIVEMQIGLRDLMALRRVPKVG